MATTQALHEILDGATVLYPHRRAVEEPGRGAVTFRELTTLSDQVRDRLHYLGIGRGARVGICMQKSIEAVAVIFGVLKTGAAYVPVDSGAPTARNAYILNDCSVQAVVIEHRFEAGLREEMRRLGAAPVRFALETRGGGAALAEALTSADRVLVTVPTTTVAPAPDDLACILYTSGSTGKPKGVMLSHCNALSFIGWCSETFQPSPKDRFSSHAPFHFDLSILDLYVSLKHGAAVVLIAEEVGKDPRRLAALIAEQRISIWYSAPSILSLLAQYGDLARYDYSSIRFVLFAGEVFPVKHLRKLKSLLPKPSYFNLYGPTETNVCTFYEIPPEIPEDRTMPFPIGRACSHLRTKVVDDAGQVVAPGTEGELCVSGPAVMQGYWNLPEPSTLAFLEEPSCQRWYKTGDIVAEELDGNYVLIGRRDRMVKRRGYRIELGEIEATLYRHPAVKEAGVVALSNDAGGVRIRAFLSCRGTARPSLVELKEFCAQNLPLYMVPDLFAFQDALPKTSTDKTDYQRLRETG